MKKLIKKLVYKSVPGFIKRRILEEGKKLAFEGNNFHCSCCERNYITFLPFGQNLRLNVLCPGCFSLERHRLMWLFLKEKLKDLKQKISVLHVAPEEFLFKKFKSNSLINYCPCAKFGDGIEDEYAPGTLNIDITEIPYENDKFDYIICNHVLEHIPDDFKAMKELYRTLKPGGLAFLQVPLDDKRLVTYEDNSITDPTERKKLFGQVDHVRVYGQDYITRLITAGFTVAIDKFAEEIDKTVAFNFGINQSEEIFLCSKKS
ncbi:class I SAM-dependent methyltransferase [soil metagenome]